MDIFWPFGKNHINFCTPLFTIFLQFTQNHDHVFLPNKHKIFYAPIKNCGKVLYWECKLIHLDTDLIFFHSKLINLTRSFH